MTAPRLAPIVRFLRSEDGPTAVEYAVMLALIVVVCLTAVRLSAQAPAARPPQTPEGVREQIARLQFGAHHLARAGGVVDGYGRLGAAGEGDLAGVDQPVAGVE